jgi:hypothetical protein
MSLWLRPHDSETIPVLLIDVRFVVLVTDPKELEAIRQAAITGFFSVMQRVITFSNMSLYMLNPAGAGD